jgi:hypothetical protein
VHEAQRVAELVQASQVNDRVAEQCVEAGALRYLVAERPRVRPDEDRGAASPVDLEPSHLAVLAARSGGPIDPHEGRVLVCRGLEGQTAVRGALPRLECPNRELEVTGAALCVVWRGRDEVAHAAVVERAQRLGDDRSNGRGQP